MYDMSSLLRVYTRVYNTSLSFSSITSIGFPDLPSLLLDFE